VIFFEQEKYFGDQNLFLYKRRTGRRQPLSVYKAVKVQQTDIHG
jgi:hypothetical protein